MNYWLAKTYTVKCQDGTVKTVFKNPKDALPLALSEGSSRTAAKLNVSDLGNGEVDRERVEKINHLLFKIDESNQSLAVDFHIAYNVFKSDPCNKSDFFGREATKMLEEQRHIRKIKISIDALIELAKTPIITNDKFIESYSNILEKWGDFSSPDAVAIEMREAREEMKEIMNGADGENAC